LFLAIVRAVEGFATEDDAYGVNWGVGQGRAALGAASDALFQAKKVSAAVLVFPKERVVLSVVVSVFNAEISISLHVGKLPVFSRVARFQI